MPIKKSILIPLVFMILIVILSSIPIDKIMNKGRHRLGALISLKSQIEDFAHVHLSFAAIQNIGHVPFFALLSFLWMKVFNKRGIEFKKAVIYTLTITFFFSIFDEFSQVFIAGRDASFFDLFLDFTGCLGGVGLCHLSKCA